MASAAAARSYLDFEPPHNVVEGTNKQTLVINLPGFKKEHLRVQIDHYGKLRISGERQLDQGNKWSRFRKEFHVPEGCDPTGVRARFEKDGVLHITMPRLSPVDAPPKMPTMAADATHGQDQSTAAGHGAAPAQPAAAEEKKRREVEAEAAAERKRRREAEEAARMRPGEEDERTSEDESGRPGEEASAARPAYGFVRDRSGMVRRLLLAVALVLVGVAGLYARYRLMGPSAGPAPADDPAVSDY